ncbi:penicillin acylase family protein [Hyphococcus lacteus]|uniref:Penicillin acylase family protein n=1 Tax=Hyphococcus lacteus TaxID=3143536 RepID=A0ABV3YZH0_9PROT
MQINHYVTTFLVWFLTTISGSVLAEDLPLPTEEQVLAGLDEPAELFVDQWGVAHIYAQNERDAYFMQGYNAARDRLWQIDLWRKRGLGRLSASFGPDYVKRDRAARLFLYRGDLDAEWKRYAPGTRQRFDAFVAGINAYIENIQANKEPLPIEFQLTGTQPEYWRANEVVRIRSNTLISNASNEIKRARTLCEDGEVAERLRRRLYPDRAYILPDGFNPCTIPQGVLEDYQLATSYPKFSHTAMDEPEVAPDGSNQWVIAPSRTKTGRPILANDPHRAFSVPSLRYLVHVNAPDVSFIGAGEPALPGISLGHNGKSAFGLTIFNADQEDIYYYKLDPDNPTRYRYKGGWDDLRIVREEIPVKNSAPVVVELAFTRHGPVLYFDKQNNRAYALRSVWFEPGAAGYAAASWLTAADHWQDFIVAAKHWGTPPLNLIWANKEGEIGWTAAGLIPLRKNWNGLLPVPGDGRYEWQGFRKQTNLPHARNPASGWFANANERNVSEDFEVDSAIASEWFDRSRVDRINSVISNNPKSSIEDSMHLQVDTHSLMARRLIALTNRLEPDDTREREALRLLRDWDLNLTVNSVSATIYEVWLNRHLGPTLIKRVVPEGTHKYLGAGSPDAVLHMLEKEDPLLGSAPQELIAEVLHESLTKTLRDLRARFGDDMSEWQWGRLHGVNLKHRLSGLADPSLAKRMNIDRIPFGGSASTPAMALYRGDSFDAVHGPSVRLVIDVGDWDKSKFINMPGQSGDPNNAHYADLFHLWANGEYGQLAFSREAVENVAEKKIIYRPEQ